MKKTSFLLSAATALSIFAAQPHAAETNPIKIFCTDLQARLSESSSLAKAHFDAAEGAATPCIAGLATFAIEAQLHKDVIERLYTLTTRVMHEGERAEPATTLAKLAYIVHALQHPELIPLEELEDDASVGTSVSGAPYDADLLDPFSPAPQPTTIAELRAQLVIAQHTHDTADLRLTRARETRDDLLAKVNGASDETLAAAIIATNTTIARLTGALTDSTAEDFRATGIALKDAYEQKIALEDRIRALAALPQAEEVVVQATAELAPLIESVTQLEARIAALAAAEGEGEGIGGHNADA